MANFTPGPWIVDKHLDIRNKDSHVIAQVSHMPGKISGKDVFNPKSMANARLIAAAPEMYEKLNDFVSEIEDFLSVYDSSVFNDEFFDLVNTTKDLLARIDEEATNE